MSLYPKAFQIISDNYFMSFRIKDFDHWLNIEKAAMPGESFLELGCFPVRNEPYDRYFGLFYTGTKPLVTQVLAQMMDSVEMVSACSEPNWQLVLPEELEDSIRGAME